MFKRVVLCCLALSFTFMASARADQEPTYHRALSPSEKAFVGSIQSDFNGRFPQAADAQNAGYVRYTNADETGAISYANMRWTSKDIRHPSQLWYDKRGNLLGADFSVPNTTGVRPHLFGVNPGRWYEFDDHVHYVVKDAATGKMKFDGYVMAPRFRKAGGDPKNPSADILVKMGRVKSTSQVATIFDFPAVWDLIVWVKPNPSGAFAEKNPLVKP
ncbi:MAG: hypothetical protein GIW99_02555 [Candidatus Eremiobacteraeota bacterium]|nr:hypothetical protein [Candidatus Eremiobacteraeota bacterium]MBC5826556.1 hypothetical protein [Candidatus Eremiobacteraeota bacterium]